jgi:glycerol kinase
MSGQYILTIDQGTTSTRALVFDCARQVIGLAQREFAQHYPADGWVEHDAEDIWRDCLGVVAEAVARAGLTAADIAAIGITNQRETVVLWDRATGAPVHRAIVWQDRRTADTCAMLRAGGHEPWVQQKTGLLLDPYFSATKIAWLLDNVPGARARAERGELACGTIDSFLLWRLTGGRSHRTDITNASRTALFDIEQQCWCPELLALFRVPAAILPEVGDSAGDFGVTDVLSGPGAQAVDVPIRGVAGDQQAALIGQGCMAPGQAKITYGTGGFMLVNTGGRIVRSRHRLLATVACRLDGQISYALEGSMFVAGAAIRWLRDGLGIIAGAGDSGAMAARLADNGGVYMVPAFVGLGAPHWCADARGLITGLTFDSGPDHLVRAALESVAYQTADLVAAMAGDGAGALAALRVDGGMAANDWFCQFLADLLGLPVERPSQIEATALGAAMLAARASGMWVDGRENEQRGGALPDGTTRFAPASDPEQRERLMAGWAAAVGRAMLG